ncbi:MAG: sugar phosphate nucleotidyltransferase, partial [Myxococcota bacterium]|nr:sugar phosphate nucleotidyltransferase [Myxococcota bacterium]
CLRLFSQHSLLSGCVLRALQLVPIENRIGVTGSVMYPSILDAVPMLPKRNILVEPSSKNTAPCIALAVRHILRLEEGTMVIWPCDHYIESNLDWLACTKEALAKVDNSPLVLVGIRPSFPADSYGYIEADKGMEILSFHEKPNPVTAKRYLKDGFLWNAGVCIARASSLFDLFQQYLPGCANLITAEDIDEKWTDVENISFDYGILERGSGFRLVEYAKGWSDLGSWDAIHPFLDKRESNNAYRGKDRLITIDSQNCSVLDDRTRPVALIGVSDLVVVSSDNGLLVMKRSDSQRVREVVQRIDEHKNTN